MLDLARRIVRRFRPGRRGEDALADCVDRNLITRIRHRKLTYLSERKLASLSAVCRDMEARQLNGSFIEAGCALGGSAILLASLKSVPRVLDVYDVFGLIPAPTEGDTPDVHARYKTIVEGKSQGIGGDRYYGYEEDLLEKVKGNFADFGIDIAARNVHLIKGLLQETMRIDGDVALAHIDVDWYDPVKTSLERIFPRLVVGGSIIFDDYYDWGGCRKAVDEYLRTIVGKAETDGAAGSLKVTRVRL
ncbi:MAG TPA: TylF/MycF/NovP-related O-methyltransferase [Dongiaceae bacterium]|nr:TylF/MycF/NovP-related O-methyltransferase [Dongiaceae bacterium]